MSIDIPINKSKIVVAMSGGIDSSTVAALLAEAGHDVTGITLQLYEQSVPAKKGACCAGQDIYDAKIASEHIGIPHYVFNYESKFKQGVIDNFVDSYLSGQTPIPCVQCNMSVKFTDLIKAAQNLGADYLATGHYIRKILSPNLAQMHKAIDFSKDQSYFLFQTTQAQLDYLLFPLGGISKDETRAHAKRLGLSIHNKPDSQDICFVPDGDYAQVIKSYRPDAIKPGDIFHVDGFKIAEHNGIHQYTIGQRRGLGIAHPYPLYVAKIDPQNNRVYVGPDSCLNSSSFYIRDVNLLADIDPEKEYTVKLRSAHPGVIAKIMPVDEIEAGHISANNAPSGDVDHSKVIYKVELADSQRAIAPGQACVIYDGTRVIGGGWICK